MQLDCKCADPGKSTALTAQKVGFLMQLHNQVDKQGSRPQVLSAMHTMQKPLQLLPALRSAGRLQLTDRGSLS